MTSSHKDWLNNEYSQWIKALQESAVDNFGEHPMVKRMLGEVDKFAFVDVVPLRHDPGVDENLSTISLLGGDFMYNVWRMEYYAQQVLKQNPTAICEIGGGVGQFYAVLRALGYKGHYYIFDLPKVRLFQYKYLEEVTKRTGLFTGQKYCDFDFCVSFYAFGEFDDETKKSYLPIIEDCDHGLMIYNPHSGASSEVPFKCNVEDEYPLTSLGNKKLTW